MGCYFAFYKNIALTIIKLLDGNLKRNTWWFFKLGSQRDQSIFKVIHDFQINFQPRLRKMLRWFSLVLFVVSHYYFLLSRITMLLYISVYHEFIKRAIAFRRFSWSTYFIVIVMLARHTLACFRKISIICRNSINWEKKSQFHMGFEPTTLLGLAGCSNHWATGEQWWNVGLWLELNRIVRSHWGITKKVVVLNSIWNSDFFPSWWYFYI